MKKLRILLVILAPLLLVACSPTATIPQAAQQGGGLTAPTLGTQGGPNTVVDSATALTIEVTNYCNGEAQVDYAWLVGFCGNNPAYNVQNLPITISTNVGSLVGQAKSAWCQSNLYLKPSGQLSVPLDTSGNPIIPSLANCPSGVAPAPITAPTGAPATKG
jgi:hypothetical protein